MSGLFAILAMARLSERFIRDLESKSPPQVFTYGGEGCLVQQRLSGGGVNPSSRAWSMNAPVTNVNASNSLKTLNKLRL